MGVVSVRRGPAALSARRESRAVMSNGRLYSRGVSLQFRAGIPTSQEHEIRHRRYRPSRSLHRGVSPVLVEADLLGSLPVPAPARHIFIAPAPWEQLGLSQPPRNAIRTVAQEYFRHQGRRKTIALW